MACLIYCKKRCPNVLKRLHKIIRGAWSNLKISEQWKSADGVYIPKEQNSTEINQFRPISLLKVERKIFFLAIVFHKTKYLTENGYIDPSVRKGKIDATTTFTLANQQIPTVSQESVKSLGRWYDSSMKDTKRGLETVELATEDLLAINRCGLQGKLKVWCLQFMLIPKLLWPLLVYEICSTTVEASEAKINKFTRGWLRVPPGLTDVAMHCKAEPPTKIHIGRV